MKKILSLILAVIFTAFCCVSVIAADPADLTGHTYTAYQIFSGWQNEGDPALFNVQWGSGIDADDFLKALQASDAFGDENPFADCDSAVKVAIALDGWADKSEEARAFAAIAEKYVNGGIEVVSGETEIDAGYYLVVDTTPEIPVGDGDNIRNIALLQVTEKGTFNIEVKVGVPELIKETSDYNNGLICTKSDKDSDDYDASHKHTKECFKWADADSAAIGDSVPFILSSAVPASASDYTYYYFVVSDTLQSGLTFDKDSLRVLIDGKEASLYDASSKKGDYNFEVKENDDGSTFFRIGLVDAKSHNGESVEVLYDAILNEDAVIGSEGNLNEASIKYNNNPKYDYKPGPDNTPGFPDEETDIPFGETPTQYTKTFVTELKVFKVDEAGNTLAGAEFTLSGNSINIVLKEKEVFDYDNNGEYWKLANGKFTKTAPIVKDYMKTAQPGATKGYVVAEAGFTGDAVVIENSNGTTTTYRAYVPAQDAGKQVYVLVKNNVATYDSVTVKYSKTIEYEQITSDVPYSVSAYVNDEGYVVFRGLNVGDYTLSETVVPKGYNGIDDIKFSLKADLPEKVTTGEEKASLYATGIDGEDTDVVYVEEDNAFEITVMNQTGPILPETGGAGTTALIILGVVLSLGAAVVIVARKRMANEAE